jgi:short-subunit dehydrogenase
MRRTMKHKVAVVTGASSGIGRATALELARRGASAIAIAARRSEPLETLADELRSKGAEVLVAPLDVTDAEAVERLARDVAGRFGTIDLWVNNAAVNLFARVEQAPVEEWHRVIETNLFGVFHGARAVVPWFREQGEGVLVNVASILSKVPSPYQSAYIASKHAVRALSNSLRQELADVDGIAVCTVLPGAIDTPLFQHAGNHTGRKVKPPSPVIDADRVARAIVRCARKPEREVTVGASTLSALGAWRAAPGLTERIAESAVEKDHFLDEHTEPTSGNVLEPVAFGTEVEGGWQSDGRGRVAAAALVVAGAGAAVLAARRARS